MPLYNNVVYLHCDNKTTDNNKQKHNIYEKNNEATILYHAIARDEDQVMELAKEAGIDMDGLSIELERSNVKDQLGKPLSAIIEDALIY